MEGIVQTIKKYKRKAYGFIKSDNKVYYFNLCDSEVVDEQDKVTFELQGEKAINVKKVNL